MSDPTDFNGVSARLCARELESGVHGHFARHLASAWFAADSYNQHLIEFTWTGLFQKAAENVKREKS